MNFNTLIKIYMSHFMPLTWQVKAVFTFSFLKVASELYQGKIINFLNRVTDLNHLYLT